MKTKNNRSSMIRKSLISLIKIRQKQPLKTKKKSSIALRVSGAEIKKEVTSLAVSFFSYYLKAGGRTLIASKCKCRLITSKEFLVGLGLFIGAAEFAKRVFGIICLERSSGEEKTLWQSIFHSAGGCIFIFSSQKFLQMKRKKL